MDFNSTVTSYNVTGVSLVTYSSSSAVASFVPHRPECETVSAPGCLPVTTVRQEIRTIIEELKAEVKRWTDLLSSKSPWGMATQKDIINKWMTTDLETAIDYSIQTVVLNFLTKDQKEGMGAFLEKRDARFTGE